VLVAARQGQRRDAFATGKERLSRLTAGGRVNIYTFDEFELSAIAFLRALHL
jgi:hypothetical protein